MDNIRSERVLKEELDYYNAYLIVQSYTSQKCADLFIDNKMSADAKKDKQIGVISQFLRANRIKVKGYNDERKLVHDLYNDLARFSVLTKYIEDKNNEIEEINVNAWNDVQVLYSDGRNEKVEHFCNPSHANDIMSRLVSLSNTKIDDAIPMAEGSLSNNTRVVVLKTPLVDDDVGAACSIRLLKPQKFNRQSFIDSGTCTEDELLFLETCIKNGVSFVVVGATSSGKTTLLNYLLSTVPNNKRIVTIEHNARELSLIKKDKEGKVVNNVVHTQTKTNDNDKRFNVTQEDLVVKALRLDPSIICVGEMRDSEAYAAQEASMTGHAVVTTLHADGVEATHFRIAMLALKRYTVDINIALLQAAMAFPVIVYVAKCEDGHRRIMEISECEIKDETTRQYRTLYEYNIESNYIKDGKVYIKGKNVRPNTISDKLKKTMLRNGATATDIERLIKK